MAFRLHPGFSERKFWEKVSPEPMSGCYLWTGAVSDFGHGCVTVNKRQTRAHRLAWEWTNGPIPDGLCVLHKCDQPACVRVDHLFLGTKQDNTDDMMRKGRMKLNPPRGERSGCAKLTEGQVLEIRRRWRDEGGAFGRGHGGRSGIHQKDLAAEYGVSQVLIGHIVTRKTWRHI